MAETKMLLAMINLVLSIGVSVMAFCRLNDMPEDAPLTRVVPCVTLLTVGLVSACQPWLGHWPTPGHVSFAFATFLYVLTTRPEICRTP